MKEKSRKKLYVCIEKKVNSIYNMKSIKKSSVRMEEELWQQKKKYMDTNYIYIIWISSRRIIRRVSVKSGLLMVACLWKQFWII